ncbi:2-dehydro-3-deoxygalactonokinase [Oleiagrimonas sp. C23AA]|uniref:2-dehydro-3-deoxygalactonokinase n=1 Tax=Oleiagrimonas sp. C23AA TaxID=2719047 RepID=UPI0014244531|nr:2-dehydro-3-deoxygalactonokinase [Oleiagrimonas sp. C23AA]NII12199.1 2-dehydro-3-deoxygalactonokinase [Oleiagrimonas sp. C23AA]
MTEHHEPATALVGLDWGTSSLRAYRLAADGAVLESRARRWGIRQLPEGGFAAALEDVTAGWPPAPLLAAGMVGARGGWQEVAYVGLPADADAVARQLCAVSDPAARGLKIVPGLRFADTPDVMRGEETQVFGALDAHPELHADARLVLPGTHSKWVGVRDGKVTDFATLMTGELFALLRQHSILGAGTDSADAVDAGTASAAFDHGVTTARDSGAAGMLSRLFSARSLTLDGSLAVAAVPDYLSGLLIGEEWRIARDGGWLRDDTSLCLIGEPTLCQRYTRAAERFDLPAPRLIEHASPRGLYGIARRAGLIDEG